MSKCIKCGSYAFNLYKEDIDQGGLCDVHYWQSRAHLAEAKQEQGEPVGEYIAKGVIRWNKSYPEVGTKLYTTPQQRKPLMVKQRKEIAARWREGSGTASEIIDMVEAAHGIKE